MAFCRNCGQPIEDGDMYCPNCGTKVEFPESNIADNPVPSAEEVDKAAAASAKKRKVLLIVICVVVVLFLLLILIMAVSNGSTTSEAALNAYCLALESQDTDAYFDCMTDDFIEELQEEYRYSKSELEDLITNCLDAWEGYDTIEFSITDSYELERSDLMQMEHEYENTYYVDDMEFDKGVVYSVSCSMTGEDDTVITEEKTFTVVCEDGRWYSLDAMSDLMQEIW